MHGKIELQESFAQQVEVLKALTEYFEKGKANPWEFELPDDLIEESALTSAIVSFKFHIEKIESKFKLSQNRVEIDRQGILDGLNERSDDMSKAIQSMMLAEES